MLGKVETQFLGLLKKFLRQERDIQIAIESEEEWKNLYRLSEIHHTVPMVYDALADTEAYSKAETSQKMLWRRQAVSMMMLQTRKTEGFLEVYHQLMQAGIKALVVKGIVCRSLYVKPDMRPSNDEDILIEKTDLTQCDKILLAQGFERKEELENADYEIAYENSKTGVKIDVHTSLFPKDMEVFETFNKEFRDAFETYEKLIINGKEVFTLNCTLHFLYLLFHSYKHFIRCGFGIRQLCDLICMAEVNKEKIDWNYVFSILKEKQLYVFYINLFDIGKRYLGLQYEKNEFGILSDKEQMLDSKNLLEDILDAGVYGKSSIAREHSVNITLSAAKSKNRKASIKSSLFPDTAYMKKEYEYLKKYRWLLPVAWTQRIFKYIGKVKRMKHIGVKDTNSVAVGKQRVELLRQYGVIK